MSRDFHPLDNAHAEHTKIQVEKINLDFEAVGIPGLEPGMTGPESVVLPLHHIPLFLATVIA